MMDREPIKWTSPVNNEISQSREWVWAAECNVDKYAGIGYELTAPYTPSNEPQDAARVLQSAALRNKEESNDE